MRHIVPWVIAALAFAPAFLHAQPKTDDAWMKAAPEPPLTAAEARAFMRELAQYVFDHHLRRDEASPMRGMIYEYFDVARKGQPDQWVQGEALDTMHDGAWFAAALANAYRATGDPFYKAFLTERVLPFYCTMLNQSDRLFPPGRSDARPGAPGFDKEHRLEIREKGFVPYWWDDGGSVSLERRRDKNPLGPFPCTDDLAGMPNPGYRLAGYSHGSSNHLAQDLGVMLQTAWLLLNESKDAKDRALAAEVAQAAKHLRECRLRHYDNIIPMCDAPAALALGDGTLMARVPGWSRPVEWWAPNNHTTQVLVNLGPRDRRALPGFADDQQYDYYAGIAKHAGKPPPSLALRVIYDAYTAPLLYRYYCDDIEPIPGVNRFDLHPYYAKGGRLEDYRSDRKGPGQGPRPIGSRLGPQNMVCEGWALQALAAYPGIWDEHPRRSFPKAVHVPLHDPAPGTARPTRWATFQVGPATVEASARRYALVLKVRSTAEAGELRVHARPHGSGSAAVIRYRGDGAVTVKNDRGEPLFFRRFDTGPAGGFTLFLPYTVVKEQRAAWANGVEHGRLSVRAGDAVVNLYLASPADQVKDWLAHDLGRGLTVWRAIFRQYGYVPTGIGAGDWDRYSDSGGYAHLISAASQWVMVLENRRDWEEHHVPPLK